MPIGRDGVEGAVPASAVAAFHDGIAPAQALAQLRQPGTVGRLVVSVRVDGVVDLLPRETTGVNHVAVSRFEIDAVNEIAIDRAVLAKIGWAAEKRHLGATRLDRQRTSHPARQTSGPGTGGQYHGLAGD